jgi:hypothetical protein
MSGRKRRVKLSGADEVLPVPKAALPPIILLADDSAALCVGLGERKFDNVGNAYRDLDMSEGFEVRLRCPRALPSRFRLELEVMEVGLTEAIAAQVDYNPLPMVVTTDGNRCAISGELPAAPRDMAVFFIAVPPSSEQPAHRLRFRSLHLQPGSLAVR